MTVQTGSQFTPEQVLEAGQRAESEGRIDYALQFYRHLTDQHRGTPEARLAAEALARLDTRPPPPPGPVANGIDYGPDYAHPASRPRPPPSYASSPDMGRRITIAPLDAARQHPVDWPRPVSDYRFAQRVARLTTWLGVPVILASGASLVAGVVAPELAVDVPLVGPLQGGTSAGFALAVTGVSMIMGGQAVRAILDTAIAARDIAAMMRAQNGGDSAERGASAEGRSRRRRKRRF